MDEKPNEAVRLGLVCSVAVPDQKSSTVHSTQVPIHGNNLSILVRTLHDILCRMSTILSMARKCGWP